MYNNIDKSYIDNLSENSNIKNLILLSNQSNVNIFNKKNKKWSLKSQDKIIKECETLKKKETKMSSSLLFNLAKLNSNTNEIKTVCNKLENKIDNLDKIIDCVKNIDEIKSESSDSYIECYSNC
jgi:enoyl-[acyl-carrier-protein] reductase (NADH)